MRQAEQGAARWTSRAIPHAACEGRRFGPVIHCLRCVAKTEDYRYDQELFSFRQAIAATLIGLFAVPLLAAQHDTIKVLVWDERQPKQAQAYDNFLGNEVAAYLKKQEGLEVRSVGLDDPDQGISAKGLDETDVLIWWGHVRQDEVTQEVTSNVVERIKAGNLAFIALHSAHWSSPFIEAMAERTRSDARRRYPDPKTKFEFIPMPGRMAPTYDSLVTPAFYAFKGGAECGRCELICRTASSLESGLMGSRAR